MASAGTGAVPSCRRRSAPPRWPELQDVVRERDQALTRSRAERHFTRWTREEEELVVAGRDEADRELALELGRTLEAIHTWRCRLRKRATEE